MVLELKLKPRGLGFVLRSSKDVFTRYLSTTNLTLVQANEYSSSPPCFCRTRHTKKYSVPDSAFRLAPRFPVICFFFQLTQKSISKVPPFTNIVPSANGKFAEYALISMQGSHGSSLVLFWHPFR